MFLMHCHGLPRVATGQGTEPLSLSLGSSAASVTGGFLESLTGPASWKVTLHSHGEASIASRVQNGNMKRLGVTKDDQLG